MTINIFEQLVSFITYDENLMFPIEAILKHTYDENLMFPIEAILKHKQVVCMRRKMLFTFFKYLFLFQRYSSF